jgi:hypothetical protein
MVAKDPKDRPQSMAELVKCLEGCKASVQSSTARNPRPLIVVDEQVRFALKQAPSATSADVSSVHLDPTPLPRKTAPDADTPRGGSGIRIDNKRQNVYIIYETDIAGLHSWMEFVRSRNCLPASISAYECGQRPAFAAIALRNRKEVAWDFTTHSEMYQFNIYSSTMHSRGFQLSLFSAYQVASRRGIISHFRKRDDMIHQTVGLDLTDARTTLDKIEKSVFRLIHFAAYPTAEGRRFAVLSSSPSVYPQRYAYEITFDALKVFASRAKADGYVPISLTASPSADATLFSIILEKVPDRACELSLGIMQETLAGEVERRIKRGFSPTVLCGFNQGDAVLYNIGWIHGHLPKGL